MAPLITFIITSGMARLLGLAGIGYLNTWPKALAIGLAAMFLLTASAHFTQPRRAGLIAIIPPKLPHPALLVTITGVLEVLGVVGLVIPPSWAVGVRTISALALAALMVVMFPANVYAAQDHRHPASPHTGLALRTIMQILFISSAVVVAVFSQESLLF
ncbi:MAG TPA: DoxX family protein [Candidatus Yaniella excrementigallinarum]|nr:DoxX family protein [Candidatus Yaniella excrementigallinarum]